jgi:putative transposase
VQVSAGAAYGLGYRVAWCPRCRRPVLAGRVGEWCRELVEEECAGRGWRVMACTVVLGQVRLLVKARPRDSPAFIASRLRGFTSGRLREELPWLRSRSCLAARAGAVSAAMVRRCIGTRHELPWREERPQ